MYLYERFQPLLFSLALIATGAFIIISIFKRDTKGLVAKLLVCGFGIYVILYPMLVIKILGIILKLIFSVTDNGNILNNPDTIPSVEGFDTINNTVQATVEAVTQTPAP